MDTLQSVFPAQNFTLLAVILGLPLIGAFVNGVFGKRLGKEAVSLMALSAVGGSFIACVVGFLLVRAGSGQGDEQELVRFYWQAWRWLTIEAPGKTVPIEVAFSLDQLNSTMTLIVTGVGFLIHLYSTKYMADDPSFHRFFCYLNLFIFSMLTLILGDNLPVLFVGWEGVGLCSYLLIGFWYEEDANASAGKKAFITNRIGDFGLLVAMGLLVYYGGGLSWTEIDASANGLATKVQMWPIGRDVPLASILPEGAAEWVNRARYAHMSDVICFFLFLGCAGKSAQIPLYVWLPDAMAGPTPVSALIHAATMVTAGVYLMCRMSSLFVVAPWAMLLVAIIGALTAFFAATIALVQTDIKKVLAYSTVSQLGYMFLGAGVGAFTAGFFHVMTHAFFKACLFLGAGSVIHAMHARIHDTDASQDMRNMGGMKAFMPHTHWTFLVSCLAIAGFPLLSGFWSKDEILYMAYTKSVSGPQAVRSFMPDLYQWPSWAGTALYVVGILAALMTAFYMFRLYFNIFHGEFRGWTIVKEWAGGHGHDDHHDDHHHDPAEPLEGPVPHESALQMTVPLMILGGLAVVAGFLNAPMAHIHILDEWLAPVFSQAKLGVVSSDPDHELMYTLAAPGVIVGLGGIGLAYYVYMMKGGAPEKAFQKSGGGFYRLLKDKWRVDELYEETFIGAVDALADFFTWADKFIVDGVIARLTAAVVQVTGAVVRLAQTGRVQAYAAMMVVGLGGLGWFLLQPHAAAKPFVNHRAGQYTVEAAPGLGYSYRWSTKNGEGDFKYVSGEEFGAARQHSFQLDRGKAQVVKLEVKNAFGGVSSRELEFERPKQPQRAPGSLPTTLKLEQGADGKVRPVLPSGHPPVGGKK